MTYGWDYFVSIFPVIAKGIPVTIQLTIIAGIFAILIGLFVAIVSYFKIPILHQLAKLYLFLIRGTPVVTQLYFFYFGLAIYFATVRDMPPLVAVALVLSINSGAFMSESFRAALESVDIGQQEAGLSLGLSRMQIMRRVIIPQAFKVAVPTLINELINLVKMSSLSFMLGVPDLMGVAKIEGARTYQYFAVYAVVMIYYLLVISILYVIQQVVEKKLNKIY